jgi:hypothetical protein
MLLRDVDKETGQTPTDLPETGGKRMSTFFSRHRDLKNNQPSFIHFSSMPLFRLEKDQQTYAHILKKKDVVNIGPIVTYFIRHSGQSAYLGGDAVKNLYLHGRKKYKTLNILAILSVQDVEKYSAIMNNIVSSNDGAFSLGFKYLVRKNRCEGCFKEIALARYVIEPRLEGPEKLLYPFRPSAIELDLTTLQRFSQACG